MFQLVSLFALIVNIIACFPEAQYVKHLIASPRTLSTLLNECKCPISMELMTDPVVASDGCTYERESIMTWLSEHNTSPISNAPLESRLVFQNRAMHAFLRELHSNAACQVRIFS
jgi:hypothetical protein